MTRFEREQWTGAEDFLARAMPAWVVCSLVAPGYPVLYISPGFLEGM